MIKMSNALGKFIMNPFTLLFLTVFVGRIFGNIKFKKVTFSACGALIVGLIIGYFMIVYAKGISKLSPLHEAATNMISKGVISQEFFDFFLILFVVSVGLISGKQLIKAIKTFGTKLLAVGLSISLAAFILAFITIQVSNINSYQIAGLFSGSMMSTPTFAVSLDAAGQKAQILGNTYSSLSYTQKQKVLDMVDENLSAKNVSSLSSEQKSKYVTMAKSYVSMGHSISYPIGVILGILTVIFLPKIVGIDIDDERIKFNSYMGKGNKTKIKKEAKETVFDIIAFSLVCLLGVALGSINIKNLSLDMAGGSLITALILSAIGKIGPINFRMNDKVLGIIKNIGLSFFLATIGLNYGYTVVTSLAGSGLKLVVIGAFLTLASMIVGYLIGKYIFKLDWLALVGALCGGITNTPMLGAAIDSVKGDEPAIGYGAAYPFGLIFKIIFVMILYKTF
ncbi:hypothetical protein [Clostridium estertheticum]|uniref:aspartate-alanine antiporter-like transporter n=1 Tax=Clostridium estertheticum TaxID=238834 RepID=UPI001C7D9967|nr:hypothetical protein [Clostridium estertheticum]MBX4268560.1 hypothetical protein [Clostridium estertheticum]WLC81381.1 hypothetical protein KTC98_09295 [Clostridium estertheticum]